MSFVRSVELFMTSEDETLIKAEDGEALQTLFEQFCDDDGLMTKEALVRDIASIRELLVRSGLESMVFQCNKFIFVCDN
jgi:hypothetical protein